jgi:general secretion pathway protein I
MVRARRRRSAEPRAIRGASGFTLVEILVALAVLAVALSAGMRAVAQSADAATLLKQRTLALWVAQNRLASAQLETPWPALGRREGNAAQANATFVWRETVSATPNPAFRRVEIVVADGAEPEYLLARLSGFVGKTAEP